MAYFEIHDLRITHRSFAGTKTVLEIGRLAIERGETYGLVGESGQGKTVQIGRASCRERVSA